MTIGWAVPMTLRCKLSFKAWIAYVGQYPPKMPTAVEPLAINKRKKGNEFQKMDFPGNEIGN